MGSIFTRKNLDIGRPRFYDAGSVFPAKILVGGGWSKAEICSVQA
jgi:hypothetical protein